MNVINTIALAEDLQARTSLSQKDASGIVRTIASTIEATTSDLVTRDQIDARFAAMDARFAELRADVRSDVARIETKFADFKAEFQVALRSQLTWIVATVVAVGSFVVALIKLT